MIYQLKLNDEVLYEGTLHDCFAELVNRAGQQTVAFAYAAGYRIEVA